MCLPCQSNNNSSVLPTVNRNIECETSYEFLLSIINSINTQMSKSNSLDVLQLLHNYKGQVISGINLGDYCYFNYTLIKTLVDEIIKPIN